MAQNSIGQWDEESYFQLEYFPEWRCEICHLIAIRAQHLAFQELSQWGPYTDTDGKNWMKCYTCDKTFHAKCLQINVPKELWNCVRCRRDK